MDACGGGESCLSFAWPQTMTTAFFLSGLPRSGSTLLGSIIGQRPDFTVTPTSPLLDLLCATNDTFKQLNVQYTFDWETKTSGVYDGIVRGWFSDIDTPYLLDKHRGYPRNVVPLKMFVSPDPKILCTIRPLADVVASYLSLIQRNGGDNFVDTALRKRGAKVNTENRAMLLADEYLRDAVNAIECGLREHGEHIHLVHYDDLVEHPEAALAAIYAFFGIEGYEHCFEDIENQCGEDKDEAWGLKNLHAIRSRLQKTSTPARTILGRSLENRINQIGSRLPCDRVKCLT